MASVKRDDSKQKWEETEFPLVCETCLGDNPYVRMTKEEHGKKCKICEAPFTVFAWQAGTKGRLKKVEICRQCARSKNVCQVCIYDLQYGLPVQLRDKILAQEGSKDAIAAVPQSDANLAWYNAQRDRDIAQGNAGAVPGTAAALKLQSMARMEPRYERNLAKLCSFFARGECNRGSACPFRHEMPRDRNDPLSKQNTKDRFYGTHDPVASKMVQRQEDRAEQRKAARAEQNGGEVLEERSRATCYVHFPANRDGTAPAPNVTEADLRDKFYSFGEIVAIRMSSKGAFIEYTTPEATELAIGSMNKQTVKDQMVYVNWARAPKRGNEAAVAAAAGNNSSSTAIKPVAPPGGLQKTVPLPPGLAPAFRPSVSVPRPPGVGNTGVPRPGGGVIRRAGLGPSRGAAPKPYYPSADPGRLGSRTTPKPPTN
eukprot:scaffold88403_cov55-Attheya_sp.AAC.4